MARQGKTRLDKTRQDKIKHGSGADQEHELTIATHL